MPATPLLSPASGFDPAKLYVWVKGLESKVNNLLRETDLVKNDLLRKNQDLRKEVKTLSSDLLELKQAHEKTLTTMDLVIKELKQTAGKEEVMVLQKYMELWNPLNFVTQKDVERAVDTKLLEREHLPESPVPAAVNLSSKSFPPLLAERHKPFG